jgi:hypothetical protein
MTTVIGPGGSGIASEMAADPVSIVCEECACITGRATGWLAHLIEDRDEPDQVPYVVFYCPVCAQREFGWVSFRAVGYT